LNHLAPNERHFLDLRIYGLKTYFVLEFLPGTEIEYLHGQIIESKKLSEKKFNEYLARYKSQDRIQMETQERYKRQRKGKERREIWILVKF
jgi:hypothetical protein